MKTHHPKLKTQLFSCGFFRHCTQTVLSPTTPQPPTLPSSTSDQPPPPPPPPPPSCHRPPHPDSSSSSSSSTSHSQSFTQWKIPLQTPTSSPLLLPLPREENSSPVPPPPPPAAPSNLPDLFHAAEIHLSSGSDSDQLAALHRLERALLPNPPSDPDCTPGLMRGVVRNLRSGSGGAKPATKILLALCLAEGNRSVAVEAGAVAAVVEAALEMEGPAAERALAALELMCTVEEGAAAVRAHALAVPAMVTMMGKTSARGKEYAISVLAVIYGGVSEEAEGEEEVTEAAVTAPAQEVARAVALALQGDCSARGRRKGAQLLKALQH